MSADPPTYVEAPAPVPRSDHVRVEGGYARLIMPPSAPGRLLLIDWPAWHAGSRRARSGLRGTQDLAAHGEGSTVDAALGPGPPRWRYAKHFLDCLGMCGHEGRPCG